MNDERRHAGEIVLELTADQSDRLERLTGARVTELAVSVVELPPRRLEPHPDRANQTTRPKKARRPE